MRFIKVYDSGIFIMIWIGSMVFDPSITKVLALFIEIEGAKNSNVLKVLVRALDDAEGSFFELDILIRIWVWSMVFNEIML